MQQRTCWRSTSAPRTAPARASDESVFRLVSPSHRARQNHRPELQSTSHEIQTRHSNISLDRGTGSDLVLVLQKMFHYMMRYKIYLLLYYRITCIQKLSHFVKIKRGQRKCSVLFGSACTRWHRVRTSRSLGWTSYSYSKKSHFTDFWLFLIFFCLLFYHTEVLISLTFILGARNLTGPISNINLTQTSSVTSRDFDLKSYFFASELFPGADSHLPHCGFCRVIDGRKEWSGEIMRWCEREQNENEMKHEVWLNLMKALRLLWWIVSLFWKRKLRSLPSPEESCIYLHK